ncbi:MAG: BlaI/MecI/CopY family transcriptional regulator [Thermodesulfobacteriota bacterium]
MKNLIARNFRSGGKGLGKVLGDLEKDVMDALWARGGATGKEVYDDLRRSREIAVTTVFTVLERLTKKGLAQREKIEGVYNFTPSYSRDEFAREVSGEVLKGVFDLWSGPAVSSLVDMLADRDPAELDRLARLIEEKKGELKRGSGE